MKLWKALPFVGLALVLCIISLGCGSNAPRVLPPTISTSSLPSGTVGVAYNQTLTATGGVAPYTWSTTSGTLPAGLTLSSGGAISGTPSAVGVSNFTVQVADSQATPAVATAQLSITINTPPLTITTSSLPAGLANETYSATLTATGGIAPYTWSLAAGSLPAGLNLGSAGTITGTPITAGTSNFTVQVADSQSTPATATAALGITVNPPNFNAALNGHYAFLVQGFGPTGQWAAMGEFVADGNGNINPGEIYDNSLNGQPFNTSYTGTYSIVANGLGTATFTGAGYSSTWSFALSSDGNGQIIRFDDATGAGTRGSGVLRKQDPSSFLLSKFVGYYVCGYTGADLVGNRLVEACEFALDGAGRIIDGTGDWNDAGSLGSFPVTGQYAPMDYNTGRASAVVDDVNYMVYAVTPSELLIMSVDPVATATYLLSGRIQQQVGNGSFNAASLQGATILQGTALGHFQGVPYAIALGGLVTFDGVGGLTVVADENHGGDFQHHAGTGTYTVASNGRVTFTGDTLPPVAYLISQNRGIGIGQISTAAFGSFEPQSGGPFTQASFEGSYTGGQMSPVNPLVSNAIAQGAADGAGNFTMIANGSSPQGLESNQPYTIAISSVDPSGVMTVTWNGGFVGYMYAVSPTKLAAVTWEDNPRIFLLEH